MGHPNLHVTAVSSSVTAIVHFAHAGLVLGGIAVVLVMISPLAIRRRRAALAELREAAASGNLVRLAELRAAGHEQKHHMTDRLRPALLVAVVGSLVAAAVHVWVCPEHFREGLRFGIFFVTLSSWQTVWTVLVVRRPDQRLFLAGLVTSAGTVVLWIITRTVGLPFGLAEVESVGLLDLTASVAEITMAIALARCLGWIRRPAERAQAVLAGRGA